MRTGVKQTKAVEAFSGSTPAVAGARWPDRAGRIALWGAACVFSATVASAQDAAMAELGRWIPSLAITSGITFQTQDSEVESRCLFGGGPAAFNQSTSCKFVQYPMLPDTSGTLRPPDNGSDWAVSPFVGGSAQLMTPALAWVPGRPRVFAFGEVLPTFAATRDIAQEGDPDGFELPQSGTGPSPPVVVDPRPGIGFVPGYTQAAITGVGSQTSSTVDTWTWGAGMGLAFPFEFRGRQLRIKPSFGWFRYRVDVEGLVLVALKDDPPAGVGANVRDCVYLPNVLAPTSASCSGIRLEQSASQSFDGIGPGLELEMDAFRWGPIGASLFLAGAAYRVLGERKVEFSASAQYPAQSTPGFPGGIPADSYVANWSFEVKPWIKRAGVGIRFHFLGF